MDIRLIRYGQGIVTQAEVQGGLRVILRVAGDAMREPRKNLGAGQCYLESYLEVRHLADTGFTKHVSC